MGLLDNIDPMSLLMGGTTMMANARGRNSRQAIPMGLEQFAQYQMLAQKQQQDAEERKQRQEQLDMQKKLHEIQLGEYQRKIDEQQKQKSAMGRLLGGIGNYIDQQDVPVESFQNVPRTPQQGAVAPDFGLDKQSVITTQKQAVPNAARYTQDITDAGFGDEMLKRQLFPAGPEAMIAPDGTVINKNDPNIIGKNFAKPEESAMNPNKPFMVVDGKVVPNKAYQDYELAKARAGASSSSTTVNSFGPKEIFKNEKDLRNEFEGLDPVKTYRKAYPAYQAIVDAATRNTPQSDINLVYGVAKLYDPESVVREGEYSTISNSQAIPERIKGFAQMLTGGGSLTAATKAELLKEAKGRITALEGQYEGARGQYQGIAERAGLSPENVFMPVGRYDKTGKKPEQSSPQQQKSKQFDVGGKKVIGVLGADGNYYVTKNGKKYRVEE